MKNNYDGWNGESSSSQEDLINSFWKLIDTSTKGTITGSGGVSNYNALNNSEIETLNNKLELYKVLDEFISENVQVPACMTQYASKWKNSVTASLSAYTEQWFKEGTATSENLKELLAGVLTQVECKTTADYCAIQFSENLKNQYSTLLGEYTAYDGSNNSDASLKAIIDAYISQMDMTAFNPDQIMADIQNIINAYFATAGIGEGDTSILEQYGYSQQEGDKLNDIQIAIIKQAIIQQSVASGTNSYDNYYNMGFDGMGDWSNIDSSLRPEAGIYRDKYLEALDNFLNNSATVGMFDLSNLNSSGNAAYAVFRGSQEYFELAVAIEIEEAFTGNLNAENKTTHDSYQKDSAGNIIGGYDLYERLKEDLGEELADMIREDSRYCDAWSSILEEAIQKAINGDFGGDTNGDGVINYYDLIEDKDTSGWSWQNGYGTNCRKLKDEVADNLYAWVKDQIISHINDFYPNGYSSSMKADDIENIYNLKYQAANKETDNDTSLQMHRDAALEVLDAVAGKGDAYRQIIKEELAKLGANDDYNQFVNNNLPSQIKSLVLNVLKKTSNIENIRLTGSGYSASMVITKGIESSGTYSCNLEFGDGTPIPQSELSFSASITSGDGTVSIDDSGKLTVTGNTSGSLTVEIDVVRDGITVYTHTLKFTVEECSKSINWGIINNDGPSRDYINAQATLYSRGLTGSGDEFKSNLPANKSMDITQLMNWIDKLYNTVLAFNSELGLDLDALETAKNQTKELYTNALSFLIDQIAAQGRLKRGQGEYFSFEYKGETYYVAGIQDDDGHERDTSKEASRQTSNANQLGIYLWVTTDRKSYGLDINAVVIREMFEKFYKAALGA